MAGAHGWGLVGTETPLGEQQEVRHACHTSWNNCLQPEQRNSEIFFCHTILPTFNMFRNHLHGPHS